ncbi:tripartite tricarboxylate transporter substrate binding protein [Piscinibacter sp. XHJ-5]|uniref:Bug family tripartite tricarboxylate transporter substrate binding protein n=1 Tax=Piscinibacter sp. XHJ-5 TaxID=3037797 RepID=UPI002452AD06|nr:tripartite tricarboxylate transporter substrate binding protein [Piscinibacter sp. XHJ-5]
MNKLGNLGRTLVWSSMILLLGLSLPLSSLAEDNPARPIRIIAPWPAGGGLDSVARIVAARLQQNLKSPVFVENIAGASTILGTQHVAKANPDGYTLLFTSNTTFSTNPWRKLKLPYDPKTSFQPVSLVVRNPLVLVANNDAPYRDVPGLLSEIARTRGKFVYASFGNATTGHLAGELFKKETNADMEHLPYMGGAPAIRDLMAGHVKILFDTAANALPFIETQRVRGLAVLQQSRSPLAPNVPAIGEYGYKSIDITVWFGLFAPAGTPDAVVQRLSREVKAIVHDPDIATRLKALHVEPVGSGPKEFADFLAADRAAMGRIIESAKIQLD